MSHRRLLGQLSFTETLLDSLPTPVFIKGVDGRYLDCNPAFEELVGFPRADIVGRRVEDVFPADQAAGARQHDEAIMASQERQTYERGRGRARRLGAALARLQVAVRRR